MSPMDLGSSLNLATHDRDGRFHTTRVGKEEFLHRAELQAPRHFPSAFLGTSSGL